MLPGVLILIVIFIRENRTSEIIHERYDPSYIEEWNGIVQNVTQNRGLIVMRLKGQRDSRYFMDSRNYDYDPYSTYKFLEAGDSVYKKRNSKEFIIFRAREKYYLVLEESINGK